MNIVFIVPRYHTNLYYRVKSLQEAGHQIHMFSLRKETSECYDLLIPRIIGYGRIYSILTLLINRIPSNRIKHIWKFNFIIPNIGKLKKELKSATPDLVLIRGQLSPFTFLSILSAKKFTSNVYLLSQLNKHYAENLKKKIFLFLLKRILQVKGIITPLKNILDKKDDFFSFLFPLLLK